jgi:hypothetical protein
MQLPSVLGAGSTPMDGDLAEAFHLGRASSFLRVMNIHMAKGERDDELHFKASPARAR